MEYIHIWGHWVVYTFITLLPLYALLGVAAWTAGAFGFKTPKFLKTCGYWTAMTNLVLAGLPVIVVLGPIVLLVRYVVPYIAQRLRSP